MKDTLKCRPIKLEGNMDCFENDVWSGWTDQKIRSLEYQLCTVKDADDRLNIIMRGTNNKFWQSSDCDSLLWLNWYTPNNLTQKQNANIANRFTAGRFGKDGRTVIFAVAADGHLWDCWASPQTIRTQPWLFRRLPMRVKGEFFAIERHYGGLEVFAIGYDNQVWHSWTKDYDNDEWSDWETIGADAYHGLFLLNNSELYPELFVNGSENELWTIRHYKNGWHDWTRLGGRFFSGCTAAVRDDGGMDVYAVSSDGTLAVVSREGLNGTWGSWRSLGGCFKKTAGAVRQGDGSTKVCMVGTDGRLYRLSGEGRFEDLGGLINHICVDTDENGRAVAVACAYDGNVYCRRI